MGFEGYDEQCMLRSKTIIHRLKLLIVVSWSVLKNINVSVHCANWDSNKTFVLIGTPNF